MLKSNKSGIYILIVGLLIYVVGAYYLNDKQVVIFGWMIAAAGVIINLVILYKVLRQRQ